MASGLLAAVLESAKASERLFVARSTSHCHCWRLGFSAALLSNGVSVVAEVFQTSLNIFQMLVVHFKVILPPSLPAAAQHPFR